MKPPPDLTPPLAEVCLRLHLRFVCFHFNLVKVFLCSRSACKELVFHNLEAFVQHWFEVHTTRKYACQLCGSVGQQKKVDEDAPHGEFPLLFFAILNAFFLKKMLVFFY